MTIQEQQAANRAFKRDGLRLPETARDPLECRLCSYADPYPDAAALERHYRRDHHLAADR